MLTHFFTLCGKSKIYLTYPNLQEAPETTHPPLIKNLKEGGGGKMLDKLNMG